MARGSIAFVIVEGLSSQTEWNLCEVRTKAVAEVNSAKDLNAIMMSSGGRSESVVVGKAGDGKTCVFCADDGSKKMVLDFKKCWVVKDHVVQHSLCTIMPWYDDAFRHETRMTRPIQNSVPYTDTEHKGTGW